MRRLFVGTNSTKEVTSLDEDLGQMGLLNRLYPNLGQMGLLKTLSNGRTDQSPPPEQTDPSETSDGPPTNKPHSSRRTSNGRPDG